MKYSSALILAATGLAMAQPSKHSHRHQHAHKRAPATQTVVVYELNGAPVSELEVLQGIANGTLVWSEAGVEVASEAPAATPSAAVIPDIQVAQVAAPPVESETPEPEPEKAQDTPAPVQEQKQEEKHDQPQAPSAPSYSHNGDFPDYDDSLSCDEFPEAFGAMPLNYLGIGGWAGIQNPKTRSSSGLDDILTIVSSLFGKGSDHEGAYFSYSCPVGYQNVQWPSLQGATKQSVGGLLCEGGKLKLTRGDVTKKLCDAGTSKVSVSIKNTLGQGVAVCRTNYPGPEDETIPTWVGAGQEAKIACPEGDNYYQWDGKPTSAQFYVNPAGVSQEEGCQWGAAGGNVGNWAPLNLGLGWSNGAAWASVFQNAPTTNEKLDFTVSIIGDNVATKCSYDSSKKQYCDNNGCNSQGCTASASSGNIQFVFE